MFVIILFEFFFCYVYRSKKLIVKSLYRNAKYISVKIEIVLYNSCMSEASTRRSCVYIEIVMEGRDN